MRAVGHHDFLFPNLGTHLSVKRVQACDVKRLLAGEVMSLLEEEEKDEVTTKVTNLYETYMP